MTHKCELCGTPVKVVGHTTKHYEPIVPDVGRLVGAINNKIRMLDDSMRVLPQPKKAKKKVARS